MYVHDKNFHYLVLQLQGTSTKYSPQRVGLQHVMNDEDVIQVIKKWTALSYMYNLYKCCQNHDQLTCHSERIDFLFDQFLEN